MKNLFLFIAMLSFSSATCVLSGETVKEIRNVSQFSGVSLAISADVYLTQGSAQKVEIEGDKTSLEEVETVVNNGTLKIQIKDMFHGNIGKVSIYITVPAINALTVSGSGDIEAKSDINTDELDLNISGSGSIRFSDLSAREVSATITGSGGIELSAGQAQSELEVVITGSGSFSAEGFSVPEADVTITGSGSAKVWAVKELETNITGSGNVAYKGDPLVNANSTGSGKTRSIQ
jgi:Putative auto-transporter adhesin, head GIN domain